MRRRRVLREIAVIAYFLAIFSIICVLVGIMADKPAPVTKPFQDFDRMADTENHCVYWDTVRFENLTYSVSDEDTVTSYQIQKQDGAYLYDRVCEKDGDAVFRFSCNLSSEDYHSFVQLLVSIMPQDVPDNPVWELSWQMGGREYTEAVLTRDPAYGTDHYEFVAWLNELENSHTNLQED